MPQTGILAFSTIDIHDLSMHPRNLRRRLTDLLNRILRPAFSMALKLNARLAQRMCVLPIFV